MTRRSSESRRRRLLQRGLMGETTSHAKSESDLERDAERSKDVRSADLETADIATRAFLGMPPPLIAGSETRSTVTPSHRITATGDVGAGLATIKSLLAAKQPLT